MTLEKFIAEAQDYCVCHINDRGKVEQVKNEVLTKAKEYYENGYSPYDFAYLIVKLVNEDNTPLNLEQFIEKAQQYIDTHVFDKERIDRYRVKIVDEAKEYYDDGYSPMVFAKSIIELTDHHGNVLRCPICGKMLTEGNSTEREECSRYGESMEYSTYKQTYKYRLVRYTTKICRSCDSKLSTKRALLRTLVLLLAIGVPIGLFFGGRALARAISIDWISLPIVFISIIGAVSFPWIALFGDSFTEWLGKLLKPLLGTYRVERKDAVR